MGVSVGIGIRFVGILGRSYLRHVSHVNIDIVVFMICR